MYKNALTLHLWWILIFLEDIGAVYL